MSIFTGIRQISIPAPAKINLFLSVLRKRNDGFHDIHSVLAKLELHDLITIEIQKEYQGCQVFCPSCPEIENKQNLVVKAFELWSKASGYSLGVSIHIDKNIPLEAGLGGGSSDAVATLLGLNLLLKKRLDQSTLFSIAREIGSDCSSFLIDGPCVASGTGEIVELFDDNNFSKIKGRKVFLFQPPVRFSTKEIYEGLYETDFSEKDLLNKRLRISDLDLGNTSLKDFLHNDLQKVVDRKFMFIKALFEGLKEKFNLQPMLSGSGSCCYFFIEENLDIQAIENYIKECWGNEIFLRITSLL